MDDWVFKIGGLFQGRRDRWKIQIYTSWPHATHVQSLFKFLDARPFVGWTSVTPAGLSHTSQFSAPTWSIILGFIFLLNFLFGFWLSERHAQFCKII